MLEALAIELASSGLARGGKKGVEKCREKLRDDKFADEIDLLATEFNETLRTAITEELDPTQYPDLVDITNNWTPVSKELDDIDDVIFVDETDAIEEIVAAIERAHQIDPAQHPDLERHLTQAVSEAYSEAFKNFHNEIAGTDKAAILEFRSADNLRDQVSSVESEISKLQNRIDGRRYYHLLDGDQKGRERASRVLANGLPDIEYHKRDDVPTSPPSNRVLLTGPKGTGKTRTLIEFIRNKTDIDQIIIPRDALTDNSNLEALTNEPFGDHVALVWDDIHDVDPVTNNRVVREAILKLEDLFTQQEDTLSIFFTARSERLEEIPGDIRNPEAVWSEFDRIQITPIDDDLSAGKFAMKVFDSMDIPTEEGNLPSVDSQTPLAIVKAYLELQLKDDKNTSAATSDEVGMWTYQYQKLRERDKQRATILDALTILLDLQITPTKSLVEGLYREVFGYDRPQDQFEYHLEALVEEGWFQIEDTSDSGPSTVLPPKSAEPLRVDTPIKKAIDPPLDSITEEIIDFLIMELADYVSTNDDQVLWLDHRWSWKTEVSYLSAIRIRFIEYLSDGPLKQRIGPNHRSYDMLKKDAKTKSSLRTTRFDPNEDRLESYFTPATEPSEAEWEWIRPCFERTLSASHQTAAIETLYARHLMRLGQVDDARSHLENVLETMNDPPTTAHGYLGVIEVYQENPKAALDYLVTVFENHARNNKWPPDSDAIAELAKLLSTVRDNESALTIYKYLGRRRNAPEILTKNDLIMWGEALRRTGDLTAAKKKYNLALERDPDYETAYQKLGTVEQSLDNTEEAIEKFGRALELTDNFRIIAHQLMEINQELSDYEDVIKHYTMTTKAFEAEIEQNPQDVITRLDYLDHLFAGTSYDVEDFEDTERQPQMIPENLYKQAIDHLQFVFDHIITDYPKLDLENEQMFEDLLVTIDRYIEAMSKIGGIDRARQTAEDILKTIPEQSPVVEARTICAYGILFFDNEQRQLWGLQNFAYRLLINRRYEAGVDILEKIFQNRQTFDPSDTHWQNLVNVTMHLVCLSRLGYSTYDTDALIEWIDSQSYDPHDIPYQGFQYLNEGSVDYRPGDFRYHAEVTGQDITVLPKQDELNTISMGDLERLTTATVLEELVEEFESSPFDDETNEALAVRPDADAFCEFYKIDGIGRELGYQLRKAGIQTAKEIDALDGEQLQKVRGIGPSKADKIMDSIKSVLEEE